MACLLPNGQLTRGIAWGRGNYVPAEHENPSSYATPTYENEPGQATPPITGLERSAYSVAVINKGESYLYDGEGWKDWSEYLVALPSDSETQKIMPSGTYTQVRAVGNFFIKVYVGPVGNLQVIALEEAQKAQKAAEEKAASMVKANTMTVKAKNITANAKSSRATQ